MSYCVVIPAFNEVKRIGDVVDSVKGIGHDCIVIDDGSSDNTGAVAAKHGALLLANAKNQGKGASLRKAFDFILKTTKYDGVIIIDGDGQHNVGDIEKFLQCAENEEVGMVVGNRMTHTKDMPFIRVATNNFMSGLLSLACRQKMPDTQCGFRCIKRSVLEAVELTTSNYEMESEILIKASRKGFKIVSVPIETIYSDEKSKIRPGKDTIRFFKMFFRLMLSR